VVGDIGSCVSALLEAWPELDGGAVGVDQRGRQKARRERRQDGTAADEQQLAMDYHARSRAQDHHQGAADASSSTKAQHARSRRGVITCTARKRIDVGTWGVMGIAWALHRRPKPASRCSRRRRLGVWFSHGSRNHLRYKLPVCIVIFNNDGIFAAPTSTPLARSGADCVRQGLAYDK